MWQLGIEMRPLFHRSTAMGYGAFIGVSVMFGHFIEGVEDRQFELLEERKQKLLEKRERQRLRDEEKARSAQGQAL